MKQITVKNAGRAGLSMLVAGMLASTLMLGGCTGADKPAASSNGAQTENTQMSDTGTAAPADPDRVNAKAVIRAAADLFTMMDLGLTDADTGTTITMSDPAYAEFFNELKSFRDVEGHEVSDASFTVDILAVNAATARGVETNYRFTITDATVTVDGKTATYSAKKGLTVE